MTRCWRCKVRVGFLGYSCKCGYTFCGRHRYPGEHDCTYDHSADAKAKISKANPLVEAAKMEKL